MRELKTLFSKNAEWIEKKTGENPDYFKNLAKDQVPLYLWIGCSDSRVPANEIVGLDAGELFVQRNIANVFPHTDFNCLSVLEYAVNILRVRHVIVCGHYGCGGVKAAMQEHRLGIVDNWLRHIRDVYAKYRDELESIQDPELRYRRLVELNVKQQALNVCHTTIVQDAWNNKQSLAIHGWVYDLETGKLKDLNCCFSGSEQLESIYKISTPKKRGA